MKLGDLLGICDENKIIVIYECGSGALLAEYDGKNSIPEVFNDCDVIEVRDNPTIPTTIYIKPKESTLAERLNKVMRDYDPYEYSNMDGSVEGAEKAIKENPESVIEELVEMLETLTEK